MTDAERDKALQDAVKEALKERAIFLRDTRDAVIALLKTAAADIQALVAGATSAFEIEQLQRAIESVLAAYGEKAGVVLSGASVKAQELGVAMWDKPLAAGGINITALLPSIDTRQLMAMRTFMVDRIKDVTASAAASIKSELGLVMIGAQGPSEAVGRVREILGDPVRTRATTIVRTEIGRAYAVASHERYLQAAERLPDLKRQWRRSGKIHSRLSHDAIDGQIRGKDEPFIVWSKKGPVKLRHPHDPQAPASETINCGCVAIPYMASWSVATPGRKPYTEEEIRLNPMKRDMADAGKGAKG